MDRGHTVSTEDECNEDLIRDRHLFCDTQERASHYLVLSPSNRELKSTAHEKIPTEIGGSRSRDGEITECKIRGKYGILRARRRTTSFAIEVELSEKEWSSREKRRDKATDQAQRCAKEAYHEQDSVGRGSR